MGSTLILLRHGQSAWNQANRFTGWWDADLTVVGEAEATAAGQLLADEQVLPDVLVKSAQYAHEEVVGHEVVQRQGGRVVRVPMKGDYSTTSLIQRLRQHS